MAFSRVVFVGPVLPVKPEHPSSCHPSSVNLNSTLRRACEQSQTILQAFCGYFRINLTREHKMGVDVVAGEFWR